ncbi:hypothetical protein [Bacillus sp. KH172YL63]|uniref:hypothetical protein n=1 Tax=Bacillus sp. KH172YL63 TaxID=2709784 RepID=UPI0013E4C4B5|nr:hypothetical protein [Bacillus sp. KH172YL63]BCB04402.1 hypothetical protein KH172YL63_25350 [Bacillus sp. KH172YL63]
MIELLLITGISTLMMLMDYPQIKKNKKEFIIYSGILLFGIGLFAAKAFQLPVPNPLDAVVLIFRPITEWINKWFI